MWHLPHRAWGGLSKRISHMPAEQPAPGSAQIVILRAQVEGV